MKTIVKLERVGKRYGQLQALNGVDLEINGSEVLGLFGHNGAGKTTLMKLILGLIEADSGSVSVFAANPAKAGAEHKKLVGFLPENVSFYEQLTGFEVLSYFARLKGFSPKDAKDSLQKVGLKDAAKRQVKTYSKGMRQRLGLAQAFIGTPKLLLLDEPTVGLDPVATQDFYLQVDELKTQGCGIILCSHVLPGVEQHINRAMILSGGQVKAVGTLEQLNQQANLPIKIQAKGLNGALYQDPDLRGFMVPDSNGELLVPVQHKLDVMQQLLSNPSLKDLSVQPPNLEQLYRHFLTHKMTKNQQERQS